ncbi:MAG: hypothetical protein A2Y94_07880 [Caldithrix sp. RBG_13_44_9]|nr:MAG: hypothetical protein A2Y94_07880 [Caldithrix sp. RBG_13_44_9]
MPKEPNRYHPYQDLLPIFYLLGQMTVIGTFLIFFLVTYLTFEDSLFNSRYIIYVQDMRVILFSGGLLLLLQLIFIRKMKVFNTIVYSRWITIKNYGIYLYGGFLGLLTVSLLLQTITAPVHLLDLILVLLILVFLWIFSRDYELSPNHPAWNHPTTSGGIIQGTAAIGLSMGLGVFPEPQLQRALGWWLLIVLVLEILTLWSRFRFLSRANLDTRSSLKTILGSHLVLFGIRFIFGLIMPLAYLLWVLLLSSSIPLHPVMLMVLVGEISERILFFVSNPPLPEQQPPTVAAENFPSS